MATVNDFLKDSLDNRYSTPKLSTISKGILKGFGTDPFAMIKIGTEEFKKTSKQEIENYLSGFGFSIKHSESEARAMLKILLMGSNAEYDEARANLVAKLTNMIESYKITSTIESEA